jgi:hypothetical protein
MLPTKLQPPPSLYNLQDWFQSVITLPIDGDSRMQTARSIAREAQHWVVPSPTLAPEERMTLYHQQYWWRLLSHLQQTFPTLLRLFDYVDFNLILGVPYLCKYPPDHWSLARVGKDLAQWIAEEYTAADKTLIFHSAILDWTYAEVFVAPSSRPITCSLALLKERLILPSHVRLLTLPFDLLSFRSLLLAHDVKFWSENDFPKLKKGKEFHFVLYRNEKQVTRFQEIQEGESKLLHWIQNGMTLDEACAALEAEGGSPFEQAQERLATWIPQWVNNNWVTTLT